MSENMQTAQDLDDIAPGEESPNSSGLATGMTGYVVGLLLAAALTAASFYMIHSHVVYGPAIPAALIALAIAQIGVHLAFFLHITTGPDNTNNVLALAFGVLIVFVVVLGSVWIMGHLNHLMMPMDRMMQHMR